MSLPWAPFCLISARLALRHKVRSRWGGSPGTRAAPTQGNCWPSTAVSSTTVSLWRMTCPTTSMCLAQHRWRQTPRDPLALNSRVDTLRATRTINLLHFDLADLRIAEEHKKCARQKNSRLSYCRKVVGFACRQDRNTVRIVRNDYLLGLADSRHVFWRSARAAINDPSCTENRAYLDPDAGLKTRDPGNDLLWNPTRGCSETVIYRSKGTNPLALR